MHILHVDPFGSKPACKVVGGCHVAMEPSLKDPANLIRTVYSHRAEMLRMSGRGPAASRPSDFADRSQ